MIKAEEKRKEGRRGKKTKGERTKEKKPKKKKTMEVTKVVEEWEIWNKKEEVAKSKKEAKKLVP